MPGRGGGFLVDDMAGLLILMAMTSASARFGESTPLAFMAFFDST